MTRVVVALGSNLGDRLAHMRQGCRGLGLLGSTAAVSSLYQSAPVGGPVQDPYLNAVVLVDTPLSPSALLDALQDIERQAGRERDERWGPRTLDLDLVLYNAVEMDTPRLQLPHPRAAERRFVLEPLAEVWEGAAIGARPVRDLLPGTASQQVTRLWQGWESPAQGFAARGGWWVVGQAALLAAWLLAFLVDLRAPARWAWLGVLPLLAGAALALSAVPALGRSLTPFPQPRHGGDLTTAGPYRIVRHPMYGGIVLMLAGLSVLGGAWTAGLVAAGLLLLFLGKSRWEERRLLAAYPGYWQYASRVRSRLIPGII